MTPALCTRCGEAFLYNTPGLAHAKDKLPEICGECRAEHERLFINTPGPISQRIQNERTVRRLKWLRLISQHRAAG